MKKIKSLFKKVFNTNTGYFIQTHLYFYGGKPAVGYVLCKGYIMFGIPGYDRIGVFVDKAEAKEAKVKLESN